MSVTPRVAEEAAADEGEFFLAHGVLSEKVEKEIECVKDKGPRRRGPCVVLRYGRRGVRPWVGLSRR